MFLSVSYPREEVVFRLNLVGLVGLHLQKLVWYLKLKSNLNKHHEDAEAKQSGA